MILIDTSIWIDHLRKTDAQIVDLLDQGLAIIHPYVIGEIALGPMRRYDLIVESLSELPQAAVAAPAEVLLLIKRHGLMGTGIGYVDAHLLASTLLTAEGRLWTRDKRLARAAAALGIAFTA